MNKIETNTISQFRLENSKLIKTGEYKEIAYKEINSDENLPDNFFENAKLIKV